MKKISLLFFVSLLPLSAHALDGYHKVGRKSKVALGSARISMPAGCSGTLTISDKDNHVLKVENYTNRGFPSRLIVTYSYVSNRGFNAALTAASAGLLLPMMGVIDSLDHANLYVKKDGGQPLLYATSYDKIDAHESSKTFFTTAADKKTIIGARYVRIFSTVEKVRGEAGTIEHPAPIVKELRHYRDEAVCGTPAL